ncbi:MAG: hypothetical protein JWL76_1472 [Thermoleophilia bacterium]|nr:hypothetical protein [Thermoleophilia bacterium]
MEPGSYATGYTTGVRAPDDKAITRRARRLFTQEPKWLGDESLLASLDGNLDGRKAVMLLTDKRVLVVHFEGILRERHVDSTSYLWPAILTAYLDRRADHARFVLVQEKKEVELVTPDVAAAQRFIRLFGQTRPKRDASNADGQIDPMDEDQFWTVIEHARTSGVTTPSSLRAALTALGDDELERFQARWDDLKDALYRWDLWAAAYLLNGGCSDDGFEYFRCYLLAQGRDVVTLSISDPDGLAEAGLAPEDDVEWEDFCYVAAEVYEGRTGNDLPRRSVATMDDPAGHPWDEADLPDRFPRLHARYG